MTKEVDLIKEKLNLVEFLRSYLVLTPAGRNFKALCPFHSEKTPSFIVSPDRQIWHCFGACGEGGDIVKFAMKYENLEFGETLRFLAEKAGIPLQTLGFKEQKEFGVLYDLHEAAKDFYKQTLLKNNQARAYLSSRKLNDETLEEFEIGFAPAGENLTLHLVKLGFDINDVARAGLTHKNLRGLYRDRFQNRIIFPILNHLGKTIAFTGRILPSSDPNQVSEIDQAKYLNSPETPIFNKSKILYGLHKSKNPIAESRTVFLVEGQMDFLSTWQAGVKNSVAVSGTGLTPHHLERLRRLADAVIISFDNDEAGLKALERSLDVFNTFDFHVKAISLGDYKDPAEACEKDPNYLKQAIEWAKPAFTHIFHTYFISRRDLNQGIAVKKRLVRHLLEKIKNIKSAVEQNIWLKELAEYSGISEMALMTELENLPARRETPSETNESNQSATGERVALIAERIMALAFGRKDKFLPLLEEKQAWLPGPYQAVLSNVQDERRNILEMRASYEFANSDEDLLDKEFGSLLSHLEIEFLKNECVGLKEEMRRAEEDNQEEKLMTIMTKFNETAHRIDELSYRKGYHDLPPR